MPAPGRIHPLLLSAVAAAAVAAFFLGLAPQQVEGHAYMMQPIARNFWASQAFQRWDYPDINYCPHCFQSRGVGGVRDRAARKTDASELRKYGNGEWPHLYTGRLANGNYLEPDSIAVRHGICGDPEQTKDESSNIYGRENSRYDILGSYVEGEIMEIKVVFSTYHWGHLEFFLCDTKDLRNPDGVVTQGCFNIHPLDRADDDGKASPIDPNYKGRYYVDPPCRSREGPDQTRTPPNAQQGDVVTARYKLPEGVTCDRCILQMVYYTGNTCKHPGYDEFDPPSNAWPGTCASTKAGWVQTSLGMCGVDGRYPEEFWNCADIEIKPNNKEDPADPPGEPAQTCPGGIPGINANDAICCPTSCGTCGGAGCGSRPGGSAACCGGGVKRSGVYCDDKKQAPCIIGKPPQTCPGGIPGINAKDVVCCPLECKQCGGSGCKTSGAAAGLGWAECCGAGVKKSGDYCDLTRKAPCIIESPPSFETCPGGIPGINANNVVCCPLECKQCGGAGCKTSGAAAGLGWAECCGAGVKKSGRKCSQTYEAPCIIETAAAAPEFLIRVAADSAPTDDMTSPAPTTPALTVAPPGAEEGANAAALEASTAAPTPEAADMTTEAPTSSPASQAL